MNLSQALRLSRIPVVAFVGGGGKTTALFQLARELPPPVIVTATTHLHVNQVKLADSHWIAEKPEDLTAFEENLKGVMLITGSMDGDRTQGVNKNIIDWLCTKSGFHDLPLLIEADGSRQHPLKAPAEHEPVIPDFVETVVVVAGLSGLGKTLTDELVHRPEIFARLSGLAIGEIIMSEALFRVLTHPAGGLKSIPAQAQRVALLNQADTPELQAQGKGLAERLISFYQSVVIASLQDSCIHSVHEAVAGVILAAGEARRYGQPKQLLDYHGQPFVRAVAQTALAAGLAPVVIVTGANADRVEASITDLPVIIVRNEEWKKGQSTSIQAGLHTFPIGTGSCIFLLADQPQVTPTVLRALVDRHCLDLSPIIAPQVMGQRANPVLFDRATFPNLLSLTGDVGGRAIFSKYPVTYLPWHDEGLLTDIDTPEDYRQLRENK
jgi:molybdenum cofactor cytidylyltransferase